MVVADKEDIAGVEAVEHTVDIEEEGHRVGVEVADNKVQVHIAALAVDMVKAGASHALVHRLS